MPRGFCVRGIALVFQTHPPCLRANSVTAAPQFLDFTGHGIKKHKLLGEPQAASQSVQHRISDSTWPWGPKLQATSLRGFEAGCCFAGLATGSNPMWAPRFMPMLNTLGAWVPAHCIHGSGLKSFLRRFALANLPKTKILAASCKPILATTVRQWSPKFPEPSAKAAFSDQQES